MNSYEILASCQPINERSLEADLYREAYRDKEFNARVKRTGKYAAIGAGVGAAGGALAGYADADNKADAKARASNKKYDRISKKKEEAGYRLGVASYGWDEDAKKKAKDNYKAVNAEYKKIRKIARRGSGKEVLKGTLKGAAKGALRTGAYGAAIGAAGPANAFKHLIRASS